MNNNVLCGKPVVREFAIVDVIKKKRDGQELCEDEIRYFINCAVNQSITEAQIGAMLMAICLRGMSDGETKEFTEAMIDSGSRLKYPAEWRGSIVGKHSTGGVGDKVSIILVPALAACGLKVPKIAGRGLGHTGGTLDKLEAIPGFRVSLSAEEIVQCVIEAGCCIVGQTTTLVPADRILYAIRDTTGTTESIPLIAGSVMSKKAVESLDALILEVTFGKAALVKTKEDGIRLAQAMTETGNRLGIRTTSVLVRMYNPIGKTIGNALEVVEAIECLQGNGPDDLLDIVCTLGAHLLVNAGQAASPEVGSEAIRRTLEDGSAAESFRKMMVAQGVEESLAKQLISSPDPLNELPSAKFQTIIRAKETGYIHGIDAYTCGCVTRNLGAGRQKPGDQIDYSVGMRITKDIGSHLLSGDAWAMVYHNTPLQGNAVSQLESALSVAPMPLPEEELSPIAEILQ